jgi:hypothetical protein
MLLDIFSDLFYRDKGMVSTTETIIMGPGCVEELDGDLTMEEIREGIQRMKQSTGC